MDYYKSEDLKDFSKVGQFAPELMAAFFHYYQKATGEAGALSAREKSLIALAVAHVKQCPYCIDAFTTSCLEKGASPEQMSEAIHVGAAMEAGVNLVHGVQMRKHLDKKGVL